MPVELISQAEYARRRGVAKSAVARAVAEKRIKLVRGKVNPALADEQWAKNTRARPDSGASTAPADGKPPAEPPREISYTDARARREHIEAEMAAIELAKLEGNLLDRASVERAAFTSGRAVRDRLMNLPVRIAPLLASITDPFEVEIKLREAIRAALSESLGDIGVAH